MSVVDKSSIESGTESPQRHATGNVSKDTNGADAAGSVPVSAHSEPVDEFEVPVAEAKQTAARLKSFIAKEDLKRAVAGFSAGVAGLVAVFVILTRSTRAIDETIDKVIGPVGQNPKTLPEHGVWVVLAGIAVHGIISVAAVYFGYSLLKAAERMFVPERIMKDSKDVELVRALLGMNAPTDAIAGKFRSMSATTLPLMKSMTELAKALRGDSADKEDKDK
ncbi:hypothetical protein [Sorangium sp. So ce1182]|uniref:hypothetical protein n=1 Tax=Sorangium sp. So ce1182 TaxID=3133334 RepID=UPI003F626E58